jgi:hypothetical protein
MIPVDLFYPNILSIIGVSLIEIAKYKCVLSFQAQTKFS